MIDMSSESGHISDICSSIMTTQMPEITLLLSEVRSSNLA